jgi:hypothetical protein
MKHTDLPRAAIPLCRWHQITLSGTNAFAADGAPSLELTKILRTRSVHENSVLRVGQDDGITFKMEPSNKIHTDIAALAMIIVKPT